MTPRYSGELPQMDFIGHLAELRRRVLISLFFFTCIGAALFSQGAALVAGLAAPVQGVSQGFIFIDPLEAFGAQFRVVVLGAFFVSLPVILWQAWCFLSPALFVPLRRELFFWLAGALGCFYGGIVFAYKVFLPVAAGFLLQFGAQIARPQISISAYVSFASFLLLAGGFIFLLPVAIAMLSKVGIVSPRQLSAFRKYAWLFLVVIAAVASPTQDVFNLFLLALPMIIFYELGIILSRLSRRRKKE
jgi:sec-independent protein translocase protein TatC